MAFFGRKIQKNNGLTVHTFFEGGGRSVRRAPLRAFAARCAAAFPWVRLSLLPAAKGSSRAFSAPFAPSLRPCRLSWGGLVSPTPPPLQPPCKTPFRATIRLILWGGSLLGETHLRRGNLALLNPCGGGQWARVRLASWRVCPKRHPQEKGKRKGKQDKQPLQGTLYAWSGTKNSLIQRRVKGAKHRGAARP